MDTELTWGAAGGQQAYQHSRHRHHSKCIAGLQFALLNPKSYIFKNVIPTLEFHSQKRLGTVKMCFYMVEMLVPLAAWRRKT